MTVVVREHSCEVERHRVIQLPLLRHSGYGATLVVEIESCPCGSRVVAQTEGNPREGEHG